jgi:subfamily B ATP-binding cassette protein HlyB/CyaB
MSSVTDESPVKTGASAVLPLDTGLICLVMLARFHQGAVEPAQLAHECGQAGTAFGTRQMLLAAKKLGLRARPLQRSVDRLERIPLPAIAATLGGGFVNIAKPGGGKVLVQDPCDQGPRILSQEELMAS